MSDSRHAPDEMNEARHRYHAMAALHETSLDIIAQLDTPKLLEALLRRGAELLHGDICSLFVYDPETGILRNVANFNSKRDWTGVTLRLGEGAIGQAVLTGKPLIVNNYEMWPFRRVENVSGLTHVMCAPLRWQERTVGAIGTVSAPGARPFDDEDLWLLGLFADLASIALNNAEMHTEIKQFTHELEKMVEARTAELSRAKEVIAVRSKQLERLMSRIVNAQETERARIARDMHDGVVQLVTAARYELRAAQVVSGDELGPEVQSRIDSARELLDDIEKEIRSAIRDLHSPRLDAGGLRPALGECVSRYHQASGLDYTLDVTGDHLSMPVVWENCVYRLVEEGLANVVAHAHAAKAAVHLHYGRSELVLTITDDGRGFDPRMPQRSDPDGASHLGLLSMEHRVGSVGGTMTVESAVGEGTRLSFTLPLVRDAE